jgi:hypothetical protein
MQSANAWRSSWYAQVTPALLQSGFRMRYPSMLFFSTAEVHQVELVPNGIAAFGMLSSLVLL